MTEETKMILERLDIMSQDIKETKAIAVEARDAAKRIVSEAQDVANEAKIIGMGAVEIANETKKELRDLERKVDNLETTIEKELQNRIEIIGEGHDLLKTKLDQALNMEKERERMWLEIMSLRIDMRTVKEKLCIA